jgi:light-regulated signal transduction histidine kinase (bacteriophytochrome)
MATLLSKSLNEVRVTAHAPETVQTFSLASFIADAAEVASINSVQGGCSLTVPRVDPLLAIKGNRELLLGALVNLLQNAFKFTRPHTNVTLHAHSAGARVMIDVSDCCGGLAAGTAESMFTPFTQRSEDRSGLGLGLSIARQSVEARTFPAQDVCSLSACPTTSWQFSAAGREGGSVVTDASHGAGCVLASARLLISLAQAFISASLKPGLTDRLMDTAARSKA